MAVFFFYNITTLLFQTLTYYIVDMVEYSQVKTQNILCLNSKEVIFSRYQGLMEKTERVNS
jgi:hypothetical protein